MSLWPQNMFWPFKHDISSLTVGKVWTFLKGLGDPETSLVGRDIRLQAGISSLPVFQLLYKILSFFLSLCT